MTLPSIVNSLLFVSHVVFKIISYYGFLIKLSELSVFKNLNFELRLITVPPSRGFQM